MRFDRKCNFDVDRLCPNCADVTRKPRDQLAPFRIPSDHNDWDRLLNELTVPLDQFSAADPRQRFRGSKRRQSVGVISVKSLFQKLARVETWLSVSRAASALSSNFSFSI